ncbi:endonuclease domain-containing protein [Actinopolymorpha pittospori]|uniref:Very-short-patch-repair endonuclease n=1 Tax=Actinopolymorpha pittospori TaxID=648752 RepID=A0A927MQ53_9ACTN|nr:endonuclease domain-containing protein [Actinopolymorpha pittospori]MBE1604836.1 very-short-patch-repair endonuclease [Actinopolymorpha pittospori]
MREKEFVTRPSWTVDILVELEGRRLVVEYDGEYWHAPDAKRLVDERKTLDLLAAGYAVVRLRENNLPPLSLEHPRLVQRRVLAAAPRTNELMGEVEAWLTAAAAAAMP